LNREWQVDPEMSGERTVTSIAVGANYVWFAWYEELKNGVSRYDVSDQSWTEVVFTELEENLPDDTTNLGINLGANDREMWFGTESEGMSYNHATSIFSDPFRYPAELTGNVPNCVLVGDDSVWFATSRGLGRLDRELIERIKQIRYGSTETQPTAPSTEDAPRPRLQ
jgi:hypothetical protein